MPLPSSAYFPVLFISRIIAFIFMTIGIITLLKSKSINLDCFDIYKYCTGVVVGTGVYIIAGLSEMLILSGCCHKGSHRGTSSGMGGGIVFVIFTILFHKLISFALALILFYVGFKGFQGIDNICQLDHMKNNLLWNYFQASIWVCLMVVIINMASLCYGCEPFLPEINDIKICKRRAKN